MQQMPRHQMNAPTTSLTPDMPHPSGKCLAAQPKKFILPAERMTDDGQT
jgi:hypothetical protein